MPRLNNVLVALAASSAAVVAVSAHGLAVGGTATSKHASKVKRQDSCYSGYAETPLYQKKYSYPNGVPYQVEGNTGACRGNQVGYNQCNSTTEGPGSMCQTSFVNSIDDFCLWGPSEPNSLVANVEGEMVAWCTKPGRGTRVIPEGALKGVQFLRAPAYLAVTGFIDQTMINIAAGDSGGEEDPHGADGLGNPMGSLMYSQGFGNVQGGKIADGTAWTQVVEWHNFMGGDQFCIKVCDPSNSNAANYCQHIYDRIGCAYNVPAAYVNGTFESCESDNQMFPGVYVGDNGKTSTYTQPPESLGAISTLPYQPVVPQSSSCTPYTSASLYTALAGQTAAAQTTSTSAASSSAATSSSASSSSTTRRSGESSAASSGASGVRANAAANTSAASSTGAASRSTSSSVMGAVAGLALFVAVGAAL